MLNFQCPNCSKQFRVNDEHAGKKVACACGQKVQIPSANGATAASTMSTQTRKMESSSPAKSDVGKITIRCNCGVALAVPASAIGKSAKCKCGAIVPIVAPSAAVVTATPVVSPYAAPQTPAAAGSGDIFGNLSNDDFGSTPAWNDFNIPAAPAASGYYSQPAAYAASASKAASPQRSSAVNPYIANAQHELRRARDSEKVSWNPVNASTFAGIGMILGALVWFFGGLAMGIIFFYPPVLLVLGMISLGRGLTASD